MSFLNFLRSLIKQPASLPSTLNRIQTLANETSAHLADAQATFNTIATVVDEHAATHNGVIASANRVIANSQAAITQVSVEAEKLKTLADTIAIVAPLVTAKK